MFKRSFLGPVSLACLLSIGLTACSDDAKQLEEATATDQPVVGSETGSDIKPPAANQPSTMDVKDKQLMDAQPEKEPLSEEAAAAKQEAEQAAAPADEATTVIEMTTEEAPAEEAVTEAVQNGPAGPELYATCAGCHGGSGEGGVGPQLAGQSKDALVASLMDYKAGKQKGAMSAMMIPNAQQLSDDEIVTVSEYITTF